MAFAHRIDKACEEQRWCKPSVKPSQSLITCHCKKHEIEISMRVQMEENGEEWVGTFDDEIRQRRRLANLR